MQKNKDSVLSGFLNHCNGAEGIHDFGDLCKYGQVRQAKGGTGASPGSHPTLETNKQEIIFQKSYQPIELQYPMHITQRKSMNALREKLYFFSLSVCHLMLLDINVTAVVSKLCYIHTYLGT